jgi:DNA-binding transcriptional regulator YiaG
VSPTSLAETVLSESTPERVADAAEGIAGAAITRVRSVFGVNRTELARLFGVRRQAVAQWETRSVPAERQEKLATLEAIVDVLTAKLELDRIPGVLKRPASAYGGRSILEAIADDEQALVLDQLRAAFDWATAP